MRKKNDHIYFEGRVSRTQRNFIKENVSRIKQMQGLVPLSDPDLQRKRKDDKFKNVPSKGSGTSNAVPQGKTRINSKTGTDPQRPTTNYKLDQRNKDTISKIQVEKQRFLSRGIQTERLDDVTKLYETGVIKYPSAGIRRSPRKELKKINGEQGDNITSVDELYEAADNLGLCDKTEHNFVKANMTNIKPKIVKNDSVRNSYQPPPNYQKGVVPKYLKERKELEKTVEAEPDCPPGHILLPEEERKETLRVLRQSYADRVQELNSLPVRSDTLKMKKRKMEIEEELKKIDEGIKVFQRPKVFVKINA
ncbi:uncharacterized protein LOC123316518 isoform X2 [Coccinella septempunctata]|uniref:uncharacterized protein LOC123316518 isoform X2 n=1 Tax=Coccinella septempunctata TaxID=41139 RepID=UPI001D07A3C6|nr:uncharacterized protein LOC123316518 isoform X2 [Coccinella septempunctata]